MPSFDPARAFQQVWAESQRDREAAVERGRRTRERWAAEGRRAAALHQLMQLFPNDSAGGTADVDKVTARMIEYAQTLPREWVKARVAFVSQRLAEMAADGKPVGDAGLKEILLKLLLLASDGEKTQVAAIFTAAVRGDPGDVAAFRWCLVNWLVDKVVDGLRPLPDEVKPPVEKPAEAEEIETALNESEAPPNTVIPNTDGAGAAKDRLQFDPQTLTITLDGIPCKIEDPKAFAVYKEIASSCPKPLTRATLQNRIPGCRGDKKIRQLLNSLPKRLCGTVPSGPNGYWLDLDPRPKRPKKRSHRQKGRS